MKKNNFLTEKPKELLKDFLDNYCELYDVDKQDAGNLIRECIEYYNHKSDIMPKYLKFLMDKWYDSVKDVENNKATEFNYSVYNDKFYFATDLWPCFVLYSRKYLMNIKKNQIIQSKIKDCKSIIDLGCGLGYSTGMLKQQYPDKEIIGTNLKDTLQYKFCKEMSKVYNFKIVESEHVINKNIDVVFASEYFEHIFDAPINIQRLVEAINPKFLLLASTFTQKSIGHFNYYRYRNYGLKLLQFIDNKKTPRVFNDTIKRLGYKPVKTGIWNNKPSFWMKDES